MTGGGPGVATETISVYIYKITTQDLTWAYVASIALFIPDHALRWWPIWRCAGWGGEADMAAIHLENLVKHFGGFSAIKQMTSRSATRNLWLCWGRPAAANPRP